MKTIYLLCVCMLMANLIFAQAILESKVPAAVVSAVKKQYVSATAIEWKLKDGVYRAEFKINKRGHDIWVDQSGAIKKAKQDIPKNDLPPVIKHKLESEFKGFTIDDADKIEMASKVYYQVKVKSGTEERKILFTSDGQVEKDKAKIEE